jgi:NhaA family Na+:H+ antiporter
LGLPARERRARKVRAPQYPLAERLLTPVRAFIRVQEIAGAPLVGATVVALFWANSRWSEHYFALRESPLTLELFGWVRTGSFESWVADALLPLFFFVAGLEIKRELVSGSLADRRHAAFPVAVAIGGMLIPALLYVVCNLGEPTQRGWGIPVATDIAFALGVLALLRGRIPAGLAILVLAFAAVDDIGAVLLIALLYGEPIRWGALLLGTSAVLVIIGLKQIGVRAMSVYWAFGAVCLLAMLDSGIHTSVAGVVLGLLAPAHPLVPRERFHRESSELGDRIGDVERRIAALPDGEESERRHELEEEEESLLGHLEALAAGTESVVDRLLRRVTPWVSYFVLPLFALVAAGVAVSSETFARTIESRVELGIVLGLAVGKPLGFLAGAWIAVRLGVAVVPPGISWRHLTGAGLLAGIGFTVALFISHLAFDGSPALLAEAKLAVLAASAISAAAGWIFLRTATQPTP